MKPIPAIVEPAMEQLEQRLIVAIADLHGIDGKISRWEGMLVDGRAEQQAKRRQIGEMLLKARGAWPERGPNAKGWGDLLRRIKISEDSALRWMADARGDKPQVAGNERRNPAADADDDTGPRIPAPPRDPTAEPPPFRQLTEADLVQALGRLDPDARKRVLKTDKANVKGGSGESDRGMWCTSAKWALAVGTWDHDPFSNPRSKIASVTRCMLEDGGDGFGGAKPGATLGLYRTGTGHGLPARTGIADADTRVWIQPPYELVEAALAHYGHTRFCALLRWSPDVKAWFPQLWARTAVVCHPFGERMEFDPPPNVDKSGDMPFPHALYYADERDVTDEVRALCIVWRVDHSLDCARSEPALHIVR